MLLILGILIGTGIVAAFLVLAARYRQTLLAERFREKGEDDGNQSA